MELRQYIAIFRRRKWLIIGVTVVGIIIAALLSYLAVPTYRSTTTVRVATVGSGVISSRPDINYTDRLMNTYSRIVQGSSTALTIKERTGLLGSMQISVELIPNTELMRISVDTSDPETAKAAATAAADILIEKSRELYAGDNQTTIDILSRQIEQTEEELTTLRAQYETLAAERFTDPAELNAASESIALKERTFATLLDEYERIRIEDAVRANAVSIVEPANLPGSPYEPRTELNLLLGALIGLFLGIGLALVVENLDTTLYTQYQIEAITKLPTLANIPVAEKPFGVIGFENSGTHRPQLESFRRLRINLLSVIPDGQPYVALLTSPDEGDGKSTIVANLAISIAKSGRSVVVVDCDMHAPRQHVLFDLPNDRGLTNYLMKQVGESGIAQETEMSNLQVITSGSEMVQPANMPNTLSLSPLARVERLRQGTELLGSVQMRALLSHLRENYDIVLLDSPAFSTVTDAAVVVPLVDHVILVVAQARANRETLRAVREQLSVMHVDAVGVVVNRAA